MIKIILKIKMKYSINRYNLRIIILKIWYSHLKWLMLKNSIKDKIINGLFLKN